MTLLQNSRISSKYMLSLSINYFKIAFNIGTQKFIHSAFSDKINLATQIFTQGIVQLQISGKGGHTAELNQNIHVTIRPGFAARHAAKNAGVLHASFPQNGGDFLL